MELKYQLFLLNYMVSGKVQVTLVWNSRNENSPGSDKLNALVNVSLLIAFYHNCFLLDVISFPAPSIFIIESDGSYD